MTGRSFGLAALWNKHEFSGDFTVEYYAGMRMRQGEMRQGAGWWSYPRVGDINLAICADGSDVFSGYGLILAAWDRFWTEKFSRIYRERELVAETGQELIPSVREFRPLVRTIRPEWDPGGRAVHGAWYFVKLRRKGRRVDLFFENRKVMSFEDPEPLSGGKIALWTQANSIVVARVRIAYENTTPARAQVVSVPTREAEPAALHPAILSDTSSGYVAKFERGLGGWQPVSGDQSALLALDATTKSEGRSSLKLVNQNAGGDFGVRVPMPQIDLSRVAKLSFDYRIPEGVKVNLYFRLAGEPHIQYFVRLTGDPFSNDVMVCLGDLDVKQDGEWHHAQFNLGAALVAADQSRRQFRPREVLIGSFHEGYLNAGFDGNPAGAAYHLDNFRLVAVGPKERPLSVARIVPKPGSPWGGEPIAVHFDQESLALLMVPLTKVEIAGRASLRPARGLHYAPATRVLTIDPAAADLSFADGEKIRFALKYADNLSREPSSDQATTQTVSWEYVMRHSRDRDPPSKPRLMDRLLDEDFEDGIGRARPYHGATGALLRLDGATPDGSRNSLRMVNKVLAGYGGISLTPGPFSIGRFPIVCLDYKTDGHLRADFHVGAAGGRGIGFTDHDRNVTMIGAVPEVRKDGRWHHAELNMKKMLDGGMDTFSARFYQASSLVLADMGYRSNVPGATMHLDNLCIVPVVSSARGLTLKWSARDPSGIAGYSYRWSRNPDDEPDRKAEGDGASATFTNLPEGNLYFHIRARDRAGNWGPTGHYRYLVDNRSPKVARMTPSNGQRSASPFVELRIDEAESGIDPASLVLMEDGKPARLSSAHCVYDTTTGALRWNWAEAQAPMEAPIPDGTKRRFGLSPVSDFAGNASQGQVWTWTVGYEKDKTGPDRPKVNNACFGAFLFHSFTDEVEPWLPLGSEGARLSRYLDLRRGDHCLKIVTVKTWDDSAAYLPIRSADVQRYPFLSFDYNFPPGARLMLRVYIPDGLGFHCIKLTRASDGYRTLAEVPDIVADGKWHRAQLDVLEIFRKAFPDTKRLALAQLAIGNWSRDFDPPGTTFFIDNVYLYGRNRLDPHFTWTAFDATGIAGYSYRLDKNRFTVPPPRVMSSSRHQKLPALDKAGMYYFHVRARDGAGNWGATEHVPYYFAGKSMGTP